MESGCHLCRADQFAGWPSARQQNFLDNGYEVVAFPHCLWRHCPAIAGMMGNAFKTVKDRIRAHTVEFHKGLAATF